MKVCPVCNFMFFYLHDETEKPGGEEHVMECANPVCRTVVPLTRITDLQDVEDLSESA